MVSTVVTSKTLAPKRRARDTTVAWKILMALTGLFFVLFVVLHMYGNLKILWGPEAYDGYATWLREAFYPLIPHGGVLLVLRILLVISLAVHGYAAVKLWLRARAARGTAYVERNTLATSYAVRTVRWGSVIIFVWVVFHLAQFTWLAVNLGEDYSTLSPYERMVFTFQQWWWVLLYGIVMLILALHVRHGLWSAFATLGGNKKSREAALNWLAIFLAGLLFLGFMLPPVLIFLNVIS
ncbi:MAG TPA: succinate dehydrogenase cytochrome b subunit [Actinomycetales bacterium]|nr:succinate dehydrogenase cytochrome b subunit [Actinomycetales bacterium]